MPNVENVSSAMPQVGGALFRAPYGTTIPTDYSTALNQAFKDVGYCDDTGFTESTGITITTKNAWGGDTVDAQAKKSEKTFKFVLLESKNAEALKTIYGDDNVTEDSNGIHIAEDAKALGFYSWVVEMITKSDKKRRHIIPNATVSNIGDIKYVDNDTISYEVTLTALVDKSGKYQHQYIEK